MRKLKTDKVTTGNMTNKRKWTRRGFLAGVFAALTAAVTVGSKKVLEGVEGEAGSQLLKVVEDIALSNAQRFGFGTAACKRGIRLFLPENRFDLVPSRHHPKLTLGKCEVAYPNQSRLIHSIRERLFEQAGETVKAAYPASFEHDLVIIGGTTSNLATRKILGPTENPLFRFALGNFEVDFPYSLAHVGDERGIDMLQAGREYESERVGIVNSNREVMWPRTRGNSIREDYLLVTRMPAASGNGDIIVFSGLHSPSIFAIENLLFSCSPTDLGYLEALVGANHYYQAVFHIPSLKYDGDSLMPEDIKLVRRGFGPVVLTPRVGVPVAAQPY